MRPGAIPEGECLRMLDKDSLKILSEALEKLDAGFAALPDFDARVPGAERVAETLDATSERLQDNYPYFHPLYAGQMLKPPHPVARLAYALAQWINPNNHALDGGRATSAMEKEAVAGIAEMFGWPEHLGHLCGGGTMANLEALWVAGQLAPGKKVLASGQAHYTHGRISGVLQLPFAAVPCDARGRMDLAKPREIVARGDVGTVVATMGTTSTGSVDPLADILELREKYGVRVHADAAYGGYFGLAGNLGEEARRAFDLLHRVDSIVIDPHKHGLQPYGCGCVLFRDPGVGKLYKHDSPYTYFSSKEMHLGEISLECSRAGASAVALWATQQLLPYTPGGAFAQGLEFGHTAAMKLHQHLKESPHFIPSTSPPQLDIVVWAVRAAKPEASSALAQRIFDEAAKRDLHLALAKLPVRFFPQDSWQNPSLIDPQTTVTCLRSVLMKPEHLLWLDQISQRLDAAAAATIGSIPR